MPELPLPNRTPAVSLYDPTAGRGMREVGVNEHDASRLPLGTHVQVRDRFEFAFRSGFEVIKSTAAGYRLRRRSDGVELPVVFPDDEVRPDTVGQGWR